VQNNKRYLIVRLICRHMGLNPRRCSRFIWGGGDARTLLEFGMVWRKIRLGRYDTQSQLDFDGTVRNQITNTVLIGENVASSSEIPWRFQGSAPTGSWLQKGCGAMHHRLKLYWSQTKPDETSHGQNRTELNRTEQDWTEQNRTERNTPNEWR
jgi:hypothetical protein